MSTFSYPIEIGDSTGERFERIEALVDTGASFTVVPASMLARLRVVPSRRLPFELADGRVSEMDVGQTWIRIDGQSVIRLVVFGSDESRALLGADVLQGLLLAVDPVGERLVPTRGLLMTAQPL